MRLWPVPVGAIAVVSVALLIAPAGAASNIATFAAPYTGATAIHFRDAVAQGCGAHLTVTNPAAFALATGLGTGRAAGRSVPCATSDSQATYDGIVGVRGLGFVPSASGTATATASWTITWNVSATMTGAAARAGAQATVEIWMQVKVYDTTAKTTATGAMVFVVQKDLAAATTFAQGAVASAHSASVTLSLTAGHSYRVYAVLGFDLAAVIPQGSPAGATVTAAVDLASTGHGGTLTGIVVR